MYKFRPATQDDMNLLLEWRNDNLTRMFSGDSAFVKLNKHEEWFSKHEEELSVFEENGIPVGVFRNNNGELSWTISPSHRGKGLGTLMVKLATEELTGVFAKIKRGNTASIAGAKGSGFIKTIDGEIEVWTK